MQRELFFDFLQSSTQMDLTVYTHSRCNDLYRDLDLIEFYTVLKSDRALSVEVWNESLQLIGKMLRNQVFLDQVSIMASQ